MESMENGLSFNLEYRVVHSDGQIRNVQGTGMFAQADGASARGTGLVRDVTDQKKLEETQQLLMGELSHRVKNMLAIVQSIAYQTERTSGSMAEFVANFGDRVKALGRAHTLLTDANWQGATLDAVVHEAVAAFRRNGADSGISASGPRVVLSANAIVSLTMALHELSTNAVKYGALSVPSGTVTLTWQREDLAGVSGLRLCWIEKGGPAVSTPSRKGFGSRLLQRGLAHEFGKVVQDYRPEGLVCTIDLPLGEKFQLG